MVCEIIQKKKKKHRLIFASSTARQRGPLRCNYNIKIQYENVRVGPLCICHGVIKRSSPRIKTQSPAQDEPTGRNVHSRVQSVEQSLTTDGK